MRKSIIYTVVTGQRDRLMSPIRAGKKFDFVCFTDNLSIDSCGWKLRPLIKDYKDPILSARFHKINSHLVVSDFNSSIWIDANITIKRDLSAFLDQCLNVSDISMFSHPDSRQSVFDEAEACIRFGRATEQEVRKQIEAYVSIGFQERAKIIPMTGLIVRNQKSNEVGALMNEWWSQILKYSNRDQISFPFVCWLRRTDINIMSFSKNFNKYFEIQPHNFDGRWQGRFQRLLANPTRVQHWIKRHI